MRRRAPCSPGPVGGLCRYDIEGEAVTTTYSEYLDNTVENAIQIGDYVICVSYGMQIAAYRADDAEPVALDETLPDFVKSIVHVGGARFAVGGRSGFIRTYEFHPDAENGARLRVISDQFVQAEAARLQLSTQVVR